MVRRRTIFFGLGAGGATQPGPSGQLGTLTTQNIGSGTGAGGGPIMGVASMSKKTSIKEFNGNSQYDQWLFVYDPRWDQAGRGVFIAAPRSANAPPVPGPAPAAGTQPPPSNQPPPQTPVSTPSPGIQQ